jgi:hypothetical protein
VAKSFRTELVTKDLLSEPPDEGVETTVETPVEGVTGRDVALVLAGDTG